ncbi:HNH endonuclease family protein [Nocardia sp. CS682]|uniref:HNH endonuclease family protein n=1 Tax=Nocardia sp. CS682 TaxID=1047172 RepID=UPI001075143F|nr:HNH endonuclease family protein [Nocardia sp. CS682]QBS43196.1 deoxyribonuclease [Nocardia sp. CS682]
MDLRRWLLGALVVLCTIGCDQLDLAPVAPAPGSPTRVELEQLLAAVRVVPDRPHPGGYDRGCKPGQGCVFGPAWTDDNDAPGGHDGCDTRNNVLALQLTEVRFRPGTRDCVVVGGLLNDPYTGKQVRFDKADANDVQIDHVYSLAAAWDMGAAHWPLERRVRFANDVEVNLLATEGRTNQAKGDKTPAEWLPPARANHCFFAGKYLTAAARYDLPVTAADNMALHGVARTCP